MANSIIPKGIPNVSEIYYASDGALLEKKGEFKFYAQSNYANLLIIHLEDGNTNEEVNLINFTPKNVNRTYTSHWFYLNYGGITEYMVNGENAPRVFSTYFIIVPNIVLQNNQKDIAITNDITVVKRYGVKNVGVYNTLLDLTNAITPTQELMNENAFAYVLSGNNYGFYQVGQNITTNLYEWELKDEVMDYGLTQKQYSSQELYVQKGFANVNNLPNINTQTIQMLMQILNAMQLNLDSILGAITTIGTNNTDTLNMYFERIGSSVFLSGEVKINEAENDLLEKSANGLYVKHDNTKVDVITYDEKMVEVDTELARLETDKLDKETYNQDQEIVDERIKDLEDDNTTNKEKIEVLEGKVETNSNDIVDLKNDKLDKDFNILQNSNSLSPNTLIAIRLGNITYKTTIANLKNFIISGSGTNSLVFDNTAQIEEWLNGTYQRPDGITPSDLVIGQFLFTIPQDDADYWVKEIPVLSLDNLVPFNEEIDLTNYYTKDEIDIMNTTMITLIGTTKQDLESMIMMKQDQLESGLNIKTINNESILGSGNVEIGGSNGVYITNQDLASTSTFARLSLIQLPLGNILKEGDLLIGSASSLNNIFRVTNPEPDDHGYIRAEYIRGLPKIYLGIEELQRNLNIYDIISETRQRRTAENFTDEGYIRRSTEVVTPSYFQATSETELEETGENRVIRMRLANVADDLSVLPSASLEILGDGQTKPYIGTTPSSIVTKKAMEDYVETNQRFTEQDKEKLDDIPEPSNIATVSAVNLQLLEKLNIRPNGTDLLVIDGKINSVYIDSLYITDIYEVSTQAEMLALTDAQKGDIAINTTEGQSYVLKQEPSSVLANWVPLLVTPSVISVNGKTGVVVLGISDISGLQDVLNTKLDVTTFETEIAKYVLKNNPITAGTFTKVVVDEKGLVTSGSSLTASDTPDLPASKITSGVFNVARIPNLSIEKINNLQATLDSKLDEATADERYIPKTTTITLLASGWDDGLNSVLVDGITPTSIVWVSPTSESYLDYVEYEIQAIAQGQSSMVFKSPDANPTMDIYVEVVYQNANN